MPENWFMYLNDFEQVSYQHFLDLGVKYQYYFSNKFSIKTGLSFLFTPISVSYEYRLHFRKEDNTFQTAYYYLVNYIPYSTVFVYKPGIQ